MFCCDLFEGKGNWSGPYAWAYGDMMMTGGEGCKDYDPHTPKHCPGQTDNEYRTEVSLYAVSSSPMMIGTDLRMMTPIMTETLLNKNMLAINQDYTAVPGDQISMCGNAQSPAWVRQLSAAQTGRVAVGLPNLGPAKAKMTVCFDSVIAYCKTLPGMADMEWSTEAYVFDVWGNSDMGSHDTQYSVEVDTHDTLLLLLKISTK